MSTRLHAKTTQPRVVTLDGVRPSAASSIACTCGGVAMVRTNGLGQCYTDCDGCHRVQAIPRLFPPTPLARATRARTYGHQHRWERDGEVVTMTIREFQALTRVAPATIHALMNGARTRALAAWTYLGEAT